LPAAVAAVDTVAAAAQVALKPQQGYLFLWGHQ
jgi:hypothetical protein